MVTITNHSLVSQFIIIGFTDLNGCEGLLFILLTIIYISTLGGNAIVFVVICSHRQLHIPLYLFVAKLSFLEILYTNVIIPKMLSNLLNDKLISYIGCLLQIYFLHCLGITETFLLTAMAFDRYLAICNPLRYPSIMTIPCCFQMAACCLIVGSVVPLTQTLLLSRLSFCGLNQIDHIFCDSTPLMNLACSDTSLNVMVDFIINSFLLFLAFTCIILSYIKIIFAVSKIKTPEGRKKAFSTCGTHLTVVLLFFVSVSFMYVRLTEHSSVSYDRVMAVIYSVLTPMCNPIIYSLRNREIKEILRRRLTALVPRGFRSINDGFDLIVPIQSM
ncbi:olfactory receptor 6N2-like [Pseudophryne corroboree]|uniref:olfactory receptor 6N2-like n=1 Tax=Pseudophryne corroboree TaxID=495146 RepID=UPI003081DFA2